MYPDPTESCHHNDLSCLGQDTDGEGPEVSWKVSDMIKQLSDRVGKMPESLALQTLGLYHLTVTTHNL